MSGLPWLRWGKGAKARNYPLLCLSYNHRRQAFYNAYSRDPQHPMVQQALQHGLRRARVLGKDTPNFVVEWLCSEHNRHHQGSGETVCGLLGESLKVEASWKKRCALEGITARNPNYQKLYDAFVRTHSEAFKETVTAFGDAKSLAHTLEFYDVYSEFQAGPRRGGARWRLSRLSGSRFLSAGSKHFKALGFGLVATMRPRYCQCIQCFGPVFFVNKGILRSALFIRFPFTCRGTVELIKATLKRQSQTDSDRPFWVEFTCQRRGMVFGKSQTFILPASQDWHLAHGDFLCGFNPMSALSTMNAMANVIVKGLRSFHPKPEIRVVLAEAMKFCAAWLGGGPRTRGRLGQPRMGRRKPNCHAGCLPSTHPGQPFFLGCKAVECLRLKKMVEFVSLV